MRRYSEEELNFLRKNVEFYTWRELADVFNEKFNSFIPWTSIRYNCVKNDIFKVDERLYTNEEILFLKKNTSNYDWEDLAKLFNKTFKKQVTKDALSLKCKKLGLFAKSKKYKIDHRPAKRYSEEEEKWLKDNYMLYTWNELCCEFNKHFCSNRSYFGLKTHCRSMGIFCKRSNDRLIHLDNDINNFNYTNLLRLSQKEFAYFQWCKLSEEGRKNLDLVNAAIQYSKLKAAIDVYKKGG